MRKFNYLVLALSALPLASAASAATYNLVGDYGASVFSYGSGDYSSATPTFTAFPSTYSNCFDVGGFGCKTSGPAGDVSGSSNVPGVGVGTAALSFITVNVPADTMWTHPGSSSDVVVRFTAATAGTYTLDGLFSRLDTMTSGSNGNNGVGVAIYKTSAGLTSQIFSSDALLGDGKTQFTGKGYDLSTLLGAGDILSYVVSNNGNYNNDSTGLTGTISTGSVPEPASWALMVGGFGLTGASLRASRRRLVLA